MTPTDHDRIQLAIVPTDAVARAAELRWGVARLESLVSPTTLANWREGWRRYATAIAHGDAPTVERLAPKIAQAIRAMEAEATSLGHQPLVPTAWEAPWPMGACWWSHGRSRRPAPSTVPQTAGKGWSGQWRNSPMSSRSWKSRIR